MGAHSQLVAGCKGSDWEGGQCRPGDKLYTVCGSCPNHTARPLDRLEQCDLPARHCPLAPCSPGEWLPWWLLLRPMRAPSRAASVCARTPTDCRPSQLHCKQCLLSQQANFAEFCLLTLLGKDMKSAFASRLQGCFGDAGTRALHSSLAASTGMSAGCIPQR